MVINGRVSLVGIDFIFGAWPQGSYRFNLGERLGNQIHSIVQPRGQILRTAWGMTGTFIQLQSGMPTPVMIMKQSQERLEIPGPLMFSYQEQAVAGL